MKINISGLVELGPNLTDLLVREKLTVNQELEENRGRQTRRQKRRRLTRMDGAGYGDTGSSLGGTGSGCGVVGAATSEQPRVQPCR